MITDKNKIEEKLDLIEAVANVAISERERNLQSMVIRFIICIFIAFSYISAMKSKSAWFLNPYFIVILRISSTVLFIYFLILFSLPASVLLA